MKIHLAILDNDKEFLHLIKLGLNIHGKEGFCTSETNEFIQHIKVSSPFICVVDYYLDYGITGLTMMRKIKTINPLSHFIFMSSQPSVDVLTDIINEGWGFFFVKKTETDFLEQLSLKIDRAGQVLEQKVQAIYESVRKWEDFKTEAKDVLNVIGS